MKRRKLSLVIILDQIKLTFVSIQFSSLIIKGFTIKAAIQIEKIIIVFGPISFESIKLRDVTFNPFLFNIEYSIIKMFYDGPNLS